jgi:hypothetical protein
MVEMTPSLARIHARICGDGYTSHSIRNRTSKELEEHPRKRVTRDWFEIKYTAEDEPLRKQFTEDVLKVFNRKCCLSSGRRELGIVGKHVYMLMKSLGAGKSREWYIPKDILDSNNIVKIAWLKAFYSDEGTVDSSRKRVRIKCTNYHALIQVQKMLLDIGIKSNITGPNCDDTWYITTKDILMFRSKINFMNVDRRETLNKLCRAK